MLKAESEARSDGCFSAKPMGAAAADSSRLGCSTADKGSVGSQIRGRGYGLRIFGLYGGDGCRRLGGRQAGGKKLGKAEFDERQQLARGKAYKAGFYTLLAGLLAVYLIPIFTEWQPKDTALLPFAVICVGVTVFACVAVANDAYLGTRQNPRAMLLVLGIVVVGNLTAGFSVMESVGFADGLAVENSMNFIIAAMGLIILAALAIRLRMAARDEE